MPKPRGMRDAKEITWKRRGLMAAVMGRTSWQPDHGETVDLDTPIDGQSSAVFVELASLNGFHRTMPIDDGLRMVAEHAAKREARGHDDSLLIVPINGIIVPVSARSASGDALPLTEMVARARSFYDQRRSYYDQRRAAAQSVSASRDGPREPLRSLDDIAADARAEFLRQRSVNPMLRLPILRRMRAQQIAAEIGAQAGGGELSGAAQQLVTDRALGIKKPKVCAPAILKF